MTTTPDMPHPMGHPNIIVAAAIAGITASLGAVMSEALQLLQTIASVSSTVAELPNADLMRDAFLRLVCIAGALGGGILSIALFPEAMDNRRRVAWKMTGSTLSGALFTPLVLRYFSWTLTADVVLGASAGVALVSWYLLRRMIPVVVDLVEKWTGKKICPDKDRRDHE